MEYTDEQLKPARSSIFWIEVSKIKPNPYQPRREFNEAALQDLADSIRQYGVLQPLVVSRQEIEKESGGLAVEYELIAGERRWRAAQIAGLGQIPALIREGDDSKMKLELAIIENLQREDLNAVERARAFQRLAEEFKFTHGQIGKKVGKSREYVSNTLRLLHLSEEILDALSVGRISEGHTRPLMMLKDREEEQAVLFKEILYKKITVREAERIARGIAHDKVRKVDTNRNPELVRIEEQLAEALGTRVHVEQRKVGGRVTIDFFSDDDLQTILSRIDTEQKRNSNELLQRFIAKQEGEQEEDTSTEESDTSADDQEDTTEKAMPEEVVETEAEDTEYEAEEAVDDRSRDEKDDMESELDDLYNIKNFSL